MTSPEFASGSPLSFVLISVASLEASLRFYRDRIGLTASPIVEIPALAAGFLEGHVQGRVEGQVEGRGESRRDGVAARVAMCQEPDTPVGRVLLVEYAGDRSRTVRQPGDRTTRGYWNLNFYVDDIRATTRELRAEGFEFWADPRSHRVGDAAGIATEVVFEGPDGVAVNLVQPEGGPDTFTGRVLAEVRRHGKTRTGFTPVATSAHCVRDIERAMAFYRDVLGMHVVIDEVLGKPETNEYLARPADARSRTVFLAGTHFYGKIALNQPLNYAVPERVDEQFAPRVGYLAQGFAVPSVDAAERACRDLPSRRVSMSGIPGIPGGDALQVRVPGSGALALLVAAR